MNDIQNLTCAAADYYWLEFTYTVTTVANQQSYDFSVLHRKIKDAFVTVGNVDYVMQEIIDPATFDSLNMSKATQRSDIPQFFHIRQNKLYLYPTPSSASNTITILGIKRPKIMTLVDYTTGTIAVTNGSKNVTGTTTAWASSNISVGSFIQIPSTTGDYYEVATVTDATHIILTVAYQGVSASGLSYRTGDKPLIPEDFQSILWTQAVEQYYMRSDQKKFNQYHEMRMEIEARLKSSTGSRATSNVWDLRKQSRVQDPNLFPRNIG